MLSNVLQLSKYISKGCVRVDVDVMYGCMDGEYPISFLG